MAKKTIKITEGDLHGIIKESVNKVLTELDWKTYANARRKAGNKGEYEKARKFGSAAYKEFNNIYGKDGVKGDIYLNRVSSDSDSFPSHTLMRMYNYDGEGNYNNPYNYDSTKAMGIMDKFDREGRYKRVKNPSLKRFFNNSEQEKAYKAASKEMDDYVMGNYEYVKGKGWYLKESKLSNIIKESVKKVLKENDDDDIYYVRGFEDYDGEITYNIRKGPYRGSESTYNQWFVTSRAVDGCQSTNYCCFEGTYEECEEWIKENS